jgi:hypothetical protein
MTFRTDNVVGLALPDSVSPGTSGLLAVSAAGIATDALTSGTATISKFYTAPNGKYYVLFSGTAQLVPDGPQCLLAEVDQLTGIPTCIDGSLNSIAWPSNRDFRNVPIQFDNSGAVYYHGSTNSGTVLRKSKNGVTTDLINQNIYISDFVVMGDGTVLLSGQTTSSGAYWTRKIGLTGGISTLVPQQAYFMTKFVDGNIYIGLWENNFGVKRYLAQTGTLESKFWLNGGSSTGDSYFSADEFCGDDQDGGRLRGFCLWYGVFAHGNMSILGQKNFVISGPGGTSGSNLMQYYPAIEKANTTVTDVSLAQRFLTDIVIAGTDANGTNMLTLYETGSKQETILVDQSNEIEIYNMTYVSATNKIMFNGLRFSDNRQVVGEIDLS